MTRLYNAPSSGYLWAGTADLECLFSDKQLVYTIDWKTGTPPKNNQPYLEHKLQTASYRAASGTQGNGVVYLNKETGLPHWYDCSESYEQDLKSFKHLARYWYSQHPKVDRDKQLASSTTICGVLDKPALVYWAANCAVDYILNQIGNIQEAVAKDTINAWALMQGLYPIFESARKNFRSVSKKAMNIGSLVHDAIELYLKDGIEPAKNVPDQVLAGFLACLEWLEQYKIKPIKIEYTVYGRG